MAIHSNGNGKKKNSDTIQRGITMQQHSAQHTCLTVHNMQP